MLTGLLDGPQTVRYSRMRFYVENNRQDVINICPYYFSANGVMSYQFSLWFDIPIGFKGNMDSYLNKEGLEDIGISSIQEIELALYISISEEVDSPYERESTFLSVSDPIRLIVGNDPGYVQVFDDSGVEAYDGNGLRIVVRSCGYMAENELGEYGGYLFNTFIENSSDEAMWLRMTSCSVNGFPVETGFLSEDVLIVSGKVAYEDFFVFDSELEGYGISGIDSLVMSFEVREDMGTAMIPGSLFPDLSGYRILFIIDCASVSFVGPE